MSPQPSPFPYESQWGDERCNAAVVLRREPPGRFHDWRADGYASEREYEYWASHVCGLACLRSVLRAWRPGLGPVPMAELIRGAVAAGALVPRPDTVDGLYYRPFLAWIAADYGQHGAGLEGAEVYGWLTGVGGAAVALASVSPEIRWPERPNERTGGHLVLVHGRDDAGRAVFHNPSGIGPTAGSAVLAPEVFARFHPGRGMLLHR